MRNFVTNIFLAAHVTMSRQEEEQTVPFDMRALTEAMKAELRRMLIEELEPIHACIDELSESLQAVSRSVHGSV